MRARFSSHYIVVPAGGRERVDSAGSTLTCFESDGALKVEFDGDSHVTELQKGMTYPDMPFKFFDLINETGSDIAVTFSVGAGKVEDRRLAVNGNISVQNASGDILNVQQRRGASFNTLVREEVIDGAVAREIIAENTSRITLTLRNLSPIYTVFIGDSDVDAATARGLPLMPNEAIVLENFTGAVWASADDGGNVDVSLIEVVE